MTRTEAKNKARDIIQESLAVAYYRVADDEREGWTDEEKDLIIEYIDKEAKRALSMIDRHYYTM